MNAVDVLVAMRTALGQIDNDVYPEDAREAESLLEAAIPVVAELIEAANAAMHATTEADQNAADARLLTALANCGGAK